MVIRWKVYAISEPLPQWQKVHPAPLIHNQTSDMNDGWSDMSPQILDHFDHFGSKWENRKYIYTYNIHTHIYTHIHTYTYTYTHIYIHTCKYIYIYNIQLTIWVPLHRCTCSYVYRMKQALCAYWEVSLGQLKLWQSSQ